MGVNITVCTKAGGPHPDWDDVRQAGDREFATLLGSAFPCVEWRDEYSDVFYRPSDFAEWRRALASWRENPDRFEQLTDILEADPDYWIQVSY